MFLIHISRIHLFSSLVKRSLQDISWKTCRYRQLWIHAFNKFYIDGWYWSEWFKSIVFGNHHLDGMWDIAFWFCTQDSNLVFSVDLFRDALKFLQKLIVDWIYSAADRFMLVIWYISISLITCISWIWCGVRTRIYDYLIISEVKSL